MERQIAKILLLIVILASLLRFYKITTIPGSLNPDEKFNGYLAYSLLKTGRDERGIFFPLSIKTFGNWTLPAYPVLTMIPVAIFGLNDFSARAIGALSGVLGTVLIYFVANEMFKKRRMALIASLLFALSPWSLFFSRISHEANLAVAFFLAALFLFLRKRYLSAAIFFGLTLFTHYAFVLFTPLFLFSLVVTQRKNIKSLKVGGVIFGVFFLVTIISTFLGSIHEVKDVGLLNDPGMLYWRVERFRSDSSHGISDTMIHIHNRYLGAVDQLILNYANSFSPSFLFDKGGEKTLHNTGYTGNLYPVEFFLLLIGVGAIFWKKEKAVPIIVAWFLLGPLPSAITKDAPSSTRLFILMPLLTLFSSYGLYWLGRSKIVTIILSAILTVSVLIFLEFYFVHLNNQRLQFFHYGYKEAALISKQYPNLKVVMVGPENFPYIAFLFYNQYDPDKFRQEVSYYPVGDTGFQFVKSFGKYEFVSKIDRKKLESDTLYIDKYQPGDKKVIATPGGEKLFSYFTKTDAWIFCGSTGIGCD